MSRSYIWQVSRPAYGNHLDAALQARDEALRTIARAIVGAYRAWRRRRRRIAALRDLEALDDRLLADINLTRGGIRHAVDGLLERER
jgi:uncharacterized protein YjiS (DUF1127 family)